MFFSNSKNCRFVLIKIFLCLGILGFSSNALTRNITEATIKAEAAIKSAIESGKLDLAQQLVTQEKNKTPHDVQWRFMEGVIQAQGGQLDQAIRTFKKITETHPEQSEAYNNLGVLYAAKGQLEESKTFLEKALQTHPSYEAAHRNLSDIRGQLAQQSYARALQIQPKASIGAPQLTLLGRIGRDVNAPPTSAAPIQSAANTPKPPRAAPPPVTSASSAPVVAAAPTQQPPDKPQAPPTPKTAAAEQDVKKAVLRWAKAWSDKDMAAYYAAYASDFKPLRGISLAQWKNDRRDRIVNKQSISVELDRITILIQNDTAVVQFQQRYAADSFKSNSRKTLNMVRQGPDWLIVRELVN
jgi:tetratricopeptide (TPR) repeat protein